MALTDDDRARTRIELANLHLSELTKDEICDDLGLTPAVLDDTLQMRRTIDPVNVWLLRDYLEREVLAQGREPEPFSWVTESARASAAQWFRLRPLPPRRERDRPAE